MKARTFLKNVIPLERTFRALLFCVGFFISSAQGEVMEQGDESSTRVKPALTASIAVPQPLTIGYERAFESIPSVRFFAEGGYFRLGLSGNLKKVSIWGIEAGARYFPLDSWLFISGALGFRQIGLSSDLSNLKLDGVSIANNADLTLNALIANLSVGGQWSLSRRLSIAVEMGMQLPIPGLHGGSTQIVQDVPDGTDLSVDDEDALYRITGMPLPKIALVRFIWYID